MRGQSVLELGEQAIRRHPRLRPLPDPVELADGIETPEAPPDHESARRDQLLMEPVSPPALDHQTRVHDHRRVGAQGILDDTRANAMQVPASRQRPAFGSQ